MKRVSETIEAICFDVGGTLRASEIQDTPDLGYIRQLMAFLGAEGAPEEFQQKIRQREKQYRRWCKRSLIELSEADLWSQYLLPDFPTAFVRQNAVKLNKLWRENRNKAMLPDAVSTLRELVARGYRLSIISNTTSSTETCEILDANGVKNLFNPIILSSLRGLRKPHPGLFFEASRAMGVPPERCAYVGDSLSRDLIGARQAGYGAVVIINVQGYVQDDFNPDDEAESDTISEIRPDNRIGRLSELLDIFKQPAAPGGSNGQAAARFYNAALSTMWGVDQAGPFAETFHQARRAGFCRFELNHKISSELYDQFESDHFYVSTVHEPCPTPYSYEVKKMRDYAISSLDEERRVASLEMIKRSIDLAVKLGAKSVVIHPGSIVGDRKRDDRLRELFEQGLKGTPEYEALRQETISHRAKEAGPFLEQTIKSLDELVAYSRGSGLLLAFENRYRYYDIPLPDEMELFLARYNEEWIGFQYDTGHAFALDALGLVDQHEWLQRFSGRVIGVHYHDVIGITDHQPPGKGEVDFQEIAKYIPAHAHKTLEVSPHASLDELRSGMEELVRCGCVEVLNP